MTASIDSKRIIVVGASRGLGRGVALALAGAGARVRAVARSPEALASLAAEGIDTRVGDAADPAFVGNLLSDDEPDGIVVVAGARPVLKPFSAYDWESFCRPWDVDVKAAFHWLQGALQRPLRPGSRVVVFSSGAALAGSPLSGGYAGAKATQRFLCRYAADDAARRDLGLKIHCLIPQLNPNTELGFAAVKAYAERAGEDPEAFAAKRFGDTPLSPKIAGASVLRLFTEPELDTAAEMMLLGAGLEPVPG